MFNPQTPIVVGVNQYTQRWQEGRLPADPLTLMQQAAQNALQDTGVGSMQTAIDAVWVVNFITHSYEDVAGDLANLLGIQPQETRYTTIGGNTPQYLVNKAAKMLEAGEIKAVLIAGAEANYGQGKALKSGLKLDWPPKKNPAKLDGVEIVPNHPVEANYKMFLPTQVYPFFENALRARAGRSIAEHQAVIGKLYARLSAVAAQNPHAWSQQAYTAEEIATPTDDNRYISFPFTKRMVANINVDQTAVLVLTTVAEAQRLGIPQEKWVFPMGGASLNEIWEVSCRPNLCESPAIRQASRLALEQAGVALGEIDAFDIYSCFPCAVEIGMEAIGLQPDEPRPISLTGGLSYFGGAGNNYAMHSIVEAVDQIRAKKHKKVMVTALGWYITKHAIGVYGDTPGKTPWQAMKYDAIQAEINAAALPGPVEKASGLFTVETYTFHFNRNAEPEEGVLIGRLADGQRALAILEADIPTMEQLLATELIGKKGDIYYDEAKRRNFVKLQA